LLSRLFYKCGCCFLVLYFAVSVRYFNDEIVTPILLNKILDLFSPTDGVWWRDVIARRDN